MHFVNRLVRSYIQLNCVGSRILSNNRIQLVWVVKSYQTTKQLIWVEFSWLLKTLSVSLQQYVGQVVIQLEGTAPLHFSVSAMKAGEETCVMSAYQQLDAVS